MPTLGYNIVANVWQGSMFHFPHLPFDANVLISASQRRVQKATEVADSRSRRHGAPEEEDELLSENDVGSDGPESEEGIDSHAEEERFRRKDGRRMERHHKEMQRGNGKARMRSAYQYFSQTRHGLGANSNSAYRHETRGAPSYIQRMTTRPWEDEMDGDGDADADGDSYMDEDRRIVNRGGPVRRPWPVGLADLDSPPGR